MKTVITLDEKDLAEILAEKFGVPKKNIIIYVKETTEGYFEERVTHVAAEVTKDLGVPTEWVLEFKQALNQRGEKK